MRADLRRGATFPFQNYPVKAPALCKVGVRMRGLSQERISNDDMVGRDVEDCNVMIQHEGEFDDGQSDRRIRQFENGLEVAILTNQSLAAVLLPQCGGK